MLVYTRPLSSSTLPVTLFDAYPVDFSADPIHDTHSIRLSVKVREKVQTTPTEEFFDIWTGFIRIVKSADGYVRDPSDGIVVVDQEFYATEEYALHTIDNGQGALVLVDVDTTPASGGTGLLYGHRYYYTVFFSTNDGWSDYPDAMFASAYAYGKQIHTDWFNNTLPRHYWDSDDGTLRKLTQIFGAYFDGRKTDGDRLAFLHDVEHMDESYIPIAESSLNWLHDVNLTALQRRKELLKVTEWLSKRGRLDNFLDAVEYSYGYRPEIYHEWLGILGPRANTEFKVDSFTSATLDLDDGRGSRVVSQIVITHGDMTITEDSYYVGHQIFVKGDSGYYLATCAEYDGASQTLTCSEFLVDGIVDGPYDVTIISGFPRLTGNYVPDDIYHKANTREILLPRFPEKSGSVSPSGLHIVVEHATLAGEIVERCKLQEPFLLSGSRVVSYHIKPQQVVEDIEKPMSDLS